MGPSACCDRVLLHSLRTLHCNSTMSEPLQVRVSRDGQEIGTYAVQEAIRQVFLGQLKPTDFYWHEGMTEWAPLSQLQASKARWLLAERALQEKQEEERKAERLAEERRKAKEKEEAENRAVSEATRIRIEEEKANRFRCQCCRESFVKPKDPADDFNPAIVGLVLSGLLTLIPIIGWVLGPILGIYCACIILASQLVPPFCPFCRSSNFSRPEKPDEQK